MKTVKERDNTDLFELTFELCARSSIQPNNKQMHDFYVEARTELESRLPFMVENKNKEKIYDFSELPKEKKDEILKGFIELTAKHSLTTFLALGLSCEFYGDIVDDLTGDEYKLTFKKIQKSDNDTETPQAKLRNQLSPFYHLAHMVSAMSENPEITPLIMEAGKQAESNKTEVNRLLAIIDNLQPTQNNLTEEKISELATSYAKQWAEKGYSYENAYENFKLSCQYLIKNGFINYNK